MLLELGCGVIFLLLFLKRNLENHENMIYSNFALVVFSIITKSRNSYFTFALVMAH